MINNQKTEKRYNPLSPGRGFAQETLHHPVCLLHSLSLIGRHNGVDEGLWSGLVPPPINSSDDVDHTVNCEVISSHTCSLSAAAAFSNINHKGGGLCWQQSILWPVSKSTG
jgi:hypothetical protein